MESVVTQILELQERLEAQRAVYESDWRDIRDLVRPATGEFNPYGVGYVPAQRSTSMYDGTAPDACEELASGLHSFLTNPVERWFELELEGSVAAPDSDALAWLEMVSDTMYAAFTDERATFNAAMHEAYLDISAFGTGTVNVEWDKDGRHMLYRSFPLTDVWFEEDSKGKLNTITRKPRWTRKQVGLEFGEENLPPELKRMDTNKHVEMVHCVIPRKDRVITSPHARNMPFASYWVSKSTKELVHESGFHTMPYMVGRWFKISGETYGKGPSFICLPDIKMLNRMEYTLIKAGEKAVDPPLMIPDDGFLTPIITSPGALLFKEPNSENIEPLLNGANIPIGFEQTEQKRAFIRKCFHVDWIRRDKKRERETAFEVADDREEQLRLMSPQLGRQESELLGPIISRTFLLLDAAGKIPPAPPSLQGRVIRPSYVSPAAVAQQSRKAVTIGRFVQDLSVVAQAKPEVMDAFDEDQFAQEMAKIRNVSRKVIRTPEQIQEIRGQRAQQQQMEQMAAAAEPLSKATKNFAQANAEGGNVTAPLP